MQVENIKKIGVKNVLKDFWKSKGKKITEEIMKEIELI